MIPYEQEQIGFLNKYLEGSSTDEELLSRYPEFFMLSRLLKKRERPVADVLIEKGFASLAAFAFAVFGDGAASNRLMEKGETVWAATANTARDDEKARQWLYQHGLHEYIRLADNVEPFSYEKWTASSPFSFK